MESIENFDGRSHRDLAGEVGVRAHLLGPFKLIDSFGCELPVTGRKVRGILAYLILAQGRPVSRRELMNFAWSDRGPEQSSASLRQALHEARRILLSEPKFLFADRENVWIDTNRLVTDVGRILGHARSGQMGLLAQALNDVRSPLLTDLDGIDAFIDRWLVEQRRSWTAELHAEVAACIGRASESERAEARGLVAFLANAKPAPEATTAAELPSPPRFRQVLLGWKWPLAALSLGILLFGGFELSRERSDDNVLVDLLQAPAADLPAQTVRSGLSGDLARVMVGRPAGLSVHLAGDRQSDTGQARLKLTGTAATIGSSLEIHVQLDDSRTHAILWSQNFAGPPGDAAALRETVATKLGAILNCALSTRHRGAAPVGDQATTLYLKACDLIGEYDLDPALDLLRQVTVVAPGFARAWADVAVTRALTADGSQAQRAAAFDEADRAAQRALSLDPHTGLAYYALAKTKPGIANWSRRVALLAHGLRVEPDGSELNNAMGQELLRVGRSGEGIGYLNRSVRFDPLNPVKTAVLIPILAYYGDRDGATALAATASALWPRNPMIWDAVFAMESRSGDPAKALVMAQDPQRLGLRNADEAQRWTTTLRARLDPSRVKVDAAIAEWTHIPADPDQDPLPVAGTLAALGRINLAFGMLARSTAPANEKYDERLFRDDLAAFRADPRFMPLAARRGLVAVWRASGRWPDFCAASPAQNRCPPAVPARDPKTR